MQRIHFANLKVFLREILHPVVVVFTSYARSVSLPKCWMGKALVVWKTFLMTHCFTAGTMQAEMQIIMPNGSKSRRQENGKVQ